MKTNTRNVETYGAATALRGKNPKSSNLAWEGREINRSGRQAFS